MFRPMATTVIFALAAAFVLSLTLRAGDGRALDRRAASRSARTC
jgi:hypothetical protein